MNTAPFTLRVRDLCACVSLKEREIRELVANGVIAPLDHEAAEWEFDPAVRAVVARAVLLHRDLQLDWHGVAMALHLLHEIEGLRAENTRLRQRLAHLEPPGAGEH